MVVPYARAASHPTYTCTRGAADYAEPLCQGLSDGTALDAFVAEQILAAVQPAALEASLAAVATVERERNELTRHWQLRLERGRYEAERVRDRHAGGIGRHGLAVVGGRLENRLSDLISPPKANAANERLAQHLWAHRDDLFTFLRQPGLDATNWRAELAIRFGVILRKVWGGSRTLAGARAQSILMSVWRTCWQQGRSALDFLRRCYPQLGLVVETRTRAGSRSRQYGPP
jgi:hypothetical protein